MRRLLPILTALWLAALAACGPNPATESPGQPPPATPLPGIEQTAPAPTEPAKPGASLPEGVLVIFNQEGGLAYSNTTLTIMLDGAARLDGSTLAGPVAWQLSESQLADLNALLASPDLPSIATDDIVNCLDCYIYRITARTPTGLIAKQVDDADFAADAPPALAELIALLNRLKEGAP